MVVLIVFLSALIVRPAEANQCGQMDTAVSKREIERINERYDDFFRYQRELEEREERMDKGRGENKQMLADHEKRLEVARLEFIKSRRPRPDTSSLEKQWEAQQKERLQSLEQARSCEVDQKMATEKMLRKGRRIPEMKEFHLDE